MARLLACMLAVAVVGVVCQDRIAHHIVRFLDTDGNELYGTPSRMPGRGEEWGGVVAEVMDGDLFGERRLTGHQVVVKKLLAPVPLPPTIYAIGLNYKDHAHNANLTIPDHPIVFYKNRHSYAHPMQPVVIPAISVMPDYEAELAVVISKDCKDVSLDDALDCVLGYTAANDVSARCWQLNTTNAVCHTAHLTGNNGQWSFSKSFDTHCPLGPSLVTKEVLGDASGLELQMHLNGQLMQNANTSNMIFGVKALVSFLSQGTTLDKGSVISTGTPGGVGFNRKPALALHDKDNMEVSLTHVGTLTNPVVRPMDM